MNESEGVRWVDHYDDIPETEKEGVSDHFVRWKDVDGLLGVNTIGLTLSYLDPGESGPMHTHEAPVEEVWLALEGRFDAETPDDSITANPGAVIYFQPGVRRRPVNNYDERAVILSCKTRDEDGTIRAHLFE